MTPQEKAKITRQEHREAQQRKEKQAQLEQDLLRENLCAVLLSEDATTAQRFESSKLLMELNRKTRY